MSGYAFGLGVERFAMLIHRVNDLRSFFRDRFTSIGAVLMIFTKYLLSQFVDISHLNINEVCVRLSSIGLEVKSVVCVECPKGFVVEFYPMSHTQCE